MVHSTEDAAQGNMIMLLNGGSRDQSLGLLWALEFWGQNTKEEGVSCKKEIQESV